MIFENLDERILSGNLGISLVRRLPERITSGSTSTRMEDIYMAGRYLPPREAAKLFIGGRSFGFLRGSTQWSRLKIRGGNVSGEPCDLGEVARLKLASLSAAVAFRSVKAEDGLTVLATVAEPTTSYFN